MVAKRRGFETAEPAESAREADLSPRTRPVFKAKPAPESVDVAEIHRDLMRRFPKIRARLAE